MLYSVIWIYQEHQKVQFGVQKVNHYMSFKSYPIIQFNL